MNKLKYEFIKNYIKENEPIEMADCMSTLSAFYDGLPAKAKGKERKAEYEYLIEQILEAFDSQIKKLAQCPYIKVEIGNQEEITDILQQVRENSKESRNGVNWLQGYAQADTFEARAFYSKVMSYIDKQIQG